MAFPITLDEAKAHLRMGPDDYDQDSVIEGFITDAAAWVEDYTGHILEAREVTEHFDGFSRLQLRAWPIQPDAVVVVTHSSGSGPVAVAGARLSAVARPGRILPALATAWPRVTAGTTVTVTLEAGYNADDGFPDAFRRAMLLLISAYDADREGGDILAKAEAAARRLCGRFRRRTL